jgi:hypothetical protein
MLGFLFGSSASESEKTSINKKCGSRVTAVKQCLRANSADACGNFQQDLDLCKVRDERRDADATLRRVSPPPVLVLAAPAPRRVWVHGLKK